MTTEESQLQFPLEHNLRKYLCFEVHKQCQKKELGLDFKFVEYLTDLLLLNPKFLSIVSKPLTKIGLSYIEAKFLNYVVDEKIQLHSLKLHYYFTTNYQEPRIVIEKHHENIKKCTEPLLAELLDVEGERCLCDLNQLYRKISVYIILVTGLGSPAEIITLKENMAALESIFTVEDVGKLVEKSKNEKIKQLNELVALVAGIRLFNRDCKKGGDQIDDVPENLTKAFKTCEKTLSDMLLKVTTVVTRLTTALEDLTAMADEDTRNVVLELPDNITPNDGVKLSEVLLFYRQLEIFVRRLLRDVENSMFHCNISIQTIALIYEELHRIVKFKDFVPLVSVYPLFDRAWQQWNALQNQLCVVTNIAANIEYMKDLEESIVYPVEALDKLLEGKVLVTDQTRLFKETMAGSCQCKYNGLPSAVASKDSFERRFELLGFCPMALVVGLLIPGNPKLKVVTNGQQYALSNETLFEQFDLNPKRYCNDMFQFARECPPIINLLNMYHDLNEVKYKAVLHEITVPRRKTYDQHVQTELHPVQTKIDPHYNWNLWQHKKQAVQWSHLVTCQTHSTQTYASHCRGDIQSQTINPRDKDSQTRKTTGTDVPNLTRHIWKVRTVGDNVCDLDLTKRLEED